jgi:hypothetical protein
MSFEPVMRNRTGKIDYLAESPISVSEIGNRDRELIELIKPYINQPDVTDSIEDELSVFEVEELLNALDNWKI